MAEEQVGGAVEQVGGAVEQVGGAGQHVELPLEMWEAILEKLEESKDIMKMLTAFPQLNGRIMTNSYVWLLDQVLPFLVPWLKHNDILLLRQVSHRWLRAVDNFVHNHLDRRPHVSGPEVAPYQYAIPEGYPGYYPITGHLLRTYDFSTVEQLNLFTKKVENHPPDRNPFLPRAVEFVLTQTQGAEAESFWKRAEEFVQQFGRHIFYMYIINDTEDEDDQDQQADFMSPDQLRALLHCVPHLKALTIMNQPYFMEEAGGRHCQPFEFNGHFPAMWELETLEIYPYNHNYLSNALIRTYSRQIKKLTINSELLRPEYGDIFPELTQLYIIRLEEADEYYQILPSLNLLHLSTLELVYISPSVLENHVIPHLVRFPGLRHLLVTFPGDDVDPEPPTTPQQVVTLPSIKYFKVDRMRVDQLNVLKYFQNLQCLMAKFELRERLTVNQTFKLNAWELLPKLKEIVYEKWGGEVRRMIRFHCTRVKYEYLKELARLEPEPEDIFPAFGSMIAGNWGNQHDSI